MPTTAQAKKAWDHMRKGRQYYEAMTPEQKAAGWQYGRDNGFFQPDQLDDYKKSEFSKYVKTDWVRYAPNITPSKVADALQYDSHAAYKGPMVPLNKTFSNTGTAAPTTSYVKKGRDLGNDDYQMDLASQPVIKQIGTSNKGVPLTINTRKFDKASKVAGAAAAGLADSVSLGLITKKMEQLQPGITAQAQKDSPAAFEAGKLYGYALPFAGATKAAAPIVKGIANPLAKKLAEGALAGGAVTAVEDRVKGKDLKTTAKDVAINSAIGAGADLGVYGLGKLAGKVLKPRNVGGNINTLPIDKTAAKEAAVTAEVKPSGTKDINETIKGIAPEIKDISGFKAYTSDIYRNMRDAFGKHYDTVKKAVLDPFDAAKKANIDMQKQWTDKLKTEVVDGLGIKKGSKLSALVQDYGEGVINEDQLKQLAPKDWEKVKKADQFFKNAYKELLDQVNGVRAKIYPNVEENLAKIDRKIEKVKADTKLSETERANTLESLSNQREELWRGKRIPERKDYYHHFNEMTQGFAAIKNIFESPSQINPKLVGVSEFTQPNSKFLDFAQKRGLGPYKKDAVGGFLDYLPAASYASHIDPQIGNFRKLANAIAENTINTKNANGVIEFLREFSNDLSGKTNAFDRNFQRVIPGGRTTMKALNWLNNRVKANTVLGNVSSSISQLANIPQGIAYVKNPVNIVDGATQTIKGILTDTPIKQSGFIAERYGDKLYRQFDTKLIDQPARFASWLLSAADELGSKFIWNSVYSKAVAEGLENPIAHADDITRKLVAGRGIGEVPLLQKSKLFQLVAPFQLEVGNLWHVQRDFLKGKDAAGLMMLYLGNYLFNKAMEDIKGSGVSFDPIKAIQDAATEKDTTPLQKAGRVAGEVLSNVPLGQTLATLYPENGTNINGVELPTRKELFGRNDPTRYGGGLLAVKGLQDPLYKLAFPFAGSQVKKTVEGLQTIKNKGSYNQDKTQLKFPVAATTENKIKAATFGPYATDESKEYYNNNRRPLSKKQTEEFNKLVALGKDPKEIYNNTLKKRELQKIKDQINEIKKDDTITDDEKQKKLKELQAKYLELSNKK